MHTRWKWFVHASMLAAILVSLVTFAHAQTRVSGCSPSIAGSSNTAVAGTSGNITVATAASLAVPVGTTQTGGAGAGGSQTQDNTAGSATNDGNASGTSSANAGDQSAGILQSGQCTDGGANVGGQNLGTVSLGNGNRGVINSGNVVGVLVQNAGGKSSPSRASTTTTLNATNNVGNANGQAAVSRGSRPNQNSTQTFVSQ